jgi:small conductance mechanosensitive channel
MNEDASKLMDEITRIVTTYGLDVVAAIVILIVGWVAASWADRVTRKALTRTPKIDAMLAGFLAGLVKYGILVFTFLAVLAQFGIQTTSFIAVLATAGLAVGLALQGTLSNVAAGVMLLIFRPFKTGDYVEGGGVAGSVDSVSLFVTEMHTPDNVHLIVPNSQLWNTAIRNYSHHPTRRVDFVFGIAYEDDIDAAMRIINGCIDNDQRALKDPAPMVVVGELADSSVNLITRVWVANADYWGVKFDLTKAVKEALDKGGITIPFPQRMVHTAGHAQAAE